MIVKRQLLSMAELDVMRVLWRAGKPCSVGDVLDGLEDVRWAYKTVGTLLTRMEEKGAVACEKVNRTNFYTPLIDKTEYVGKQTEALVTKLYDGSVKDLAVSLFKSGNMTKEDIDEIRKMFDL